MILRLLIAAMMILAIAKFYLDDPKSAETKPKQQIEGVQIQLNDFSKQVEDNRKKVLKDVE